MTAVYVSPDDPSNSHHIKLSDGVTDVGLILCSEDGQQNPRAFTSDPVQRSSIKMYTGEAQYSDLEPPWQDVVVDDFSGGRGGSKFEVDRSKYWDGTRVDTSNRGAIIGPMELWDKGTAVRLHATYWPTYDFSSGLYYANSYTLYSLYGTQRFVAVQFTAPSSNMTAEYGYFWAKTIGGANRTLSVCCYSDSSGSPNTLVNIARSVTITPELKLYRTNDLLDSLTASTTYWFVFDGGATASSSACVQIVCDGAGSGEKKSTTGLAGSWSSGSTGKPYFRVEQSTPAGSDIPSEFRAHFAELKGVLYCGAEYADGSTSKVFVCGTGGSPTTATSASLTDTNNSGLATDNNYDGGIARIVDGKGSYLPSPWRGIASTVGSASKITIPSDTPWGVIPDTTSVYALVATDRWSEVTGHGLAANEYITDALSVGGAIYWGCGPSTNMIRYRRWYDTVASTYADWDDEGTAGTFLARLTRGATTEIWKADRTLPSKIYSAAAADCTGTVTVASLSFSTISVGDLGDKITGLTVYGEDYPDLHVFKEGSIYRVIDGVPYDLRIGGYHAARDERNGYTSVVNDVYLYFSFLDSIERYYSGSLDDIGPNKDDGLPDDRRGMISALVAYPGVLYAAIDGGRRNYSSIICWNNQGWHEVWRAPGPVDVTDLQPRLYGKMYIQPVPGDSADRLYFSWHNSIISLCVLPNPYNHNDMSASGLPYQYYMYAPGCSIETGWIHFGLESVEKLFNAITIHGSNLSSSYSSVWVDYKVDDDADYTEIGQVTITDDSGKVYLDHTTHNITGKRIRVRVRLETRYDNSTPRLEAIVVEGLVVLPSKQRIVMTFRLTDYGETLRNDIEDSIPDADTKLAKLREWAADAGTVGMSGHIAELNGLRVKLDYPSLRVIKHKEYEVNRQKQNEYICQLGVWVID